MEEVMNKAINKENSRNLTHLRKRVKRLHKIKTSRLSEAVCDIIDLQGYGLAVLLKHLPEFELERQKIIAHKIEDFLYFHPEKGQKLAKRLLRAIDQVAKECRPMLLAAVVDVTGEMAQQEEILGSLIDQARVTLNSSADFPRKSKAMEVISEKGNRRDLCLIINNLIKATTKPGEFSCYQFIENSLLVSKKLSGESFLRLLINPISDNTIKNFKMQWRDADTEVTAEVLNLSQQLDAEFAQTLLKVVDLADFNLPFASMISEGAAHSDKWVRQTAVASMARASKALSPESISRLLNDPSAEVRLMAVSSLGGFAAEQTGEVLQALAEKEGETIGTRMNALYALHAQKNIAALEHVAQACEPAIALNAIGLAALLRPRAEGLAALLDIYGKCKTVKVRDLNYYLLELTQPEDLKLLVDFCATLKSDLLRENCLILLKTFLAQKAGPKLDRALAALSEYEKKALDLLRA
jgi:hypothetical protein